MLIIIVALLMVVQLVASINAKCVLKCSVRKRTCNFIHKFIWEKQSRTNVANVRKLSLIQVIYLNIHVYILVLNLIDVKFVNVSLHNYLIYNSTYVRTLEINRTSAVILVVIRHSLNCQIYNHIQGVIKQTNLSSVTVVTNVLLMKHHYLNIYQSIKSRNISRLIYVNTVVKVIHRKHI